MSKLKDVTPQHLRCTFGACPAVYEYGGELVIIAKRAPAELVKELENKIGDDELAVVIDPKYFEQLKE